MLFAVDLTRGFVGFFELTTQRKKHRFVVTQAILAYPMVMNKAALLPNCVAETQFLVSSCSPPVAMIPSEISIERGHDG
jgi:hypothetical protein